ncbi:MAG: IS30 family transposase [Spirochaetaceae bacterium]|nr:IS30 family transposase [Spirochaetaceae bacterium]
MPEWLWNGKGGKTKERSPTKLAAILGKSRRTVIREIQRGLTARRRSCDWKDIEYYSAELAQIKADENRQSHGPAEKIGSDRTLADAIADKIRKEKYSPYAVTAEFDNEGWPSLMRLRAKTTCRYIGKGIFAEAREADLPRQGKKRKKSGKPPKHGRIGAIMRSIDKRPAAANERTESGHWETGTVKGVKNGNTDCLFTLTDRKTRAEIIRKLPDGKAASVVAALDGIERELGADFSSVFKSITADNGAGFSDYEALERSCLSDGKRCGLFFAHPYRSGERGTNENSNGIIRRFFPKGTDFSTVSEEAVAKVQSWINNYPRKILHGQPPIKIAPSRLLA